jgi:hypothetical protein
MLGALRAILPGVAFAQTSATMVSLWAFDETTDVSGVFDDLGSANVPMSLVGTWADLTTGSLVQNVGGTSAYTSGTAYATLPANQPAHNLAALTISFYYQRNAAAGTQVLLAAGNGTQAGDFSIEVLADGKLRGFHVGQDGVSRPFEGTGGITGTNLQVGTAHRIDLALGPRGARIFLDGAELTVAAIPSNLNGWNNSRIKYLGVSPDGTSSPAIGAFDRFRIWSWQLTNVEIALLEEARPTTLPPLSPPGGALSVPSLAEWLVSDEPTPMATKFVSNQNRGNGSGSSAANAQEVQAALNGASPGDVLLAVCQTAGTIEFWNYPNGLDFPSGSAGNLITLQARQGDGVVISAGEDFADARTPNNGFWTQSGLSAADIDKHIWRSVSTFSGGAQSMMGWWIEFDHPHQLVRAVNMTNLRAAYGTADSPDNYSGPMVHKDTDGRVYIRFQRPHPDKYSTDNKWSVNTWPGFPEAVRGGKLVYPISEDPNDYAIYLTRTNATVYGFDPTNSGHHVKIGSGINSMGFRHAIRGSNAIQMHRGLHYTWQDFIGISVAGSEKDDYFLSRVRCTDGSKLHLSRGEWKFGGHLEGIRSACFRNSVSAGGVSNFYWKDCTIADYHEAYVGRANGRRLRFRNCTFHSILDDGFQYHFTNGEMEWGYCFFYNSAYGGPGESDSEGGPTVPAQMYFHHNIVDLRQERSKNWRAQACPQFCAGSHSPDGINPWKTYNNLIIFGPDAEEELGPMLMHCPTGSNNTSTGAANMHQVFNNILLRVFLEGTKRYDAVSSLGGRYSDNFDSRSDYVSGRRWVRYSAVLSNELFDYNLYWRSPGMNVNGLLREYARGKEDTVNNYATLAAWKASAEFEHSKLSGSRRGAYSPGVDGNSTESKPTLPSIDNYPTDRFKYRPSPTTAVTVATSGSLSGSNWWSTPPSWGDDYFPWNDTESGCLLAPSGFKGALDPNGATINVGVLNL